MSCAQALKKRRIKYENCFLYFLANSSGSYSDLVLFSLSYMTLTCSSSPGMGVGGGWGGTLHDMSGLLLPAAVKEPGLLFQHRAYF